jgi:histidine ammonia-lyase
MTNIIKLTGLPLTIDQLVCVARDQARIEIDSDTRERIAASRQRLLATISDGQPYYGINTGFGSLSQTRIDDTKLAGLQLNLIRSHASGVGDPLPVDVVRATMVALAASLCRGLSGVRPAVPETIIALLNADITPEVPEIGSVGASGDLAPLSHIALSLVGEGQCMAGGRPTDAASALRDAGITPLSLEPKEGLALINGTHLMAGRGALVVHDCARAFRASVGAAALSMDACRTTHRFLDPRVHDARKHSGAIAVAGALRTLLHGSEIAQDHAEDDPRVQDPYSFRCAPGVLGAAYDLLKNARTAIEAELGAVTDNPLVFPGEDTPADIISAGNFHGMPIALPLDTLALTAAHTAGIAERRLFHMLSVFDSESGLKPFLSPHPGLHSGYMIVQYAAAAACNELIGLCMPATVSNIPTCAQMEDYNSFGPRAVAKADRSVSLLRHVVAAELLCSAQALETHRPLRSGTGVENIYKTVRKYIPALDTDRSPAPDLRKLDTLIAEGAFDNACAL